MTREQEGSEIVLQLTHGDNNPRNSEGAFATLADGRILFAYSRFYGAGGDDHGFADICVRTADATGRGWSASDTTLVKNEGGCNVMSVSLLRLLDGRIALFYLVKNGLDDCRLRMRVSADEAANWSDAVCCIPAPGYFVVNNDRVIQLRGGRLVASASFHRTRKAAPRKDDYSGLDGRGIAVFFLSDDAGATWRESKDWWALPERSGAGLQEPGVVELNDGRLYGYCRTDRGCQYELFSEDGGETWTPPRPASFLSPCSPLSIKRLPATGGLLAVWNDHDPRWGEPVGGVRPHHGRTPLVTAVSRDEGRTWTHHRRVECAPDHGYCYTAIHPLADAVLLAYCCGSYQTGILADSCVRRLSLDWLYGA